MGIKDNCAVWDDVFDRSLDEELAPEIDRVANPEFASKINKIYTDSLEFFKRTYFSPAMIDLLEKIVYALRGERGYSNVYTIYSLFGGGKTHTLLTVYHAFRNPRALRNREVLSDYDPNTAQKLQILSEKIEELADEVKIVVVYGKDHSGPFGGGTPERPHNWGNYSTHTVWGLIAHQLGKYDLLKADDENHTAPSPTTLSKLFEDKKVLILMDEIVELAHNLGKSGSRAERDYASNIPTFIERLTKAIHNMDSVLLITMPFELKDNEIKGIEIWYERQMIASFWKALKNVGERVSPLTHTIERDDLVKVLKKRIFQSIKCDLDAIKSLRKSYREFKNIFGDIDEPDLEEYYPFHPIFVRIVRDIVERAELQKTRDLLRITRLVVRKLWQGKENPYFIMPWHIDTTDPTVRSLLFASSNFTEYGNVHDTDIVEGLKKLYPEKSPKHKLATVVMRSIFLSTYYYDSPTQNPKFPSLIQVARMVYEQEFFEKNKLSPTHIQDVLERVSNSMCIVHLYSSEGRYWFWRIGNVKKIIESEASKLRKHIKRLDKKICDYTEKLIKGEGKGLKKPQVKKILHPQRSAVLYDLDVEIDDSRDYYVFFIPRDDVDEETFRKLMFKKGESVRNYQNTVILVYMSSGTKENVRHIASYLCACDVVIDKISQYYKDKGEEVIKIQKEMVKRIKDSMESNLIKALMSSYTKIAYPSRKDGKEVPEIVDAPEGGSNLLDTVYWALKKPDIGKIIDAFAGYSTLHDILSAKMRINLSEGSRSYRVREILDWFYTNPSLPMIDNEDVKNALKSGVTELKIGIANKEIWFKKVFTEVPDTKVLQGNPPSRIDENYIVLPWKEAIRRQVEELLKTEGRKDDNKMVVYYLVVEDEHIPLRDVINHEGWEEAVQMGYILKTVVEAPKEQISIHLNPEEIKGQPGDSFDVKFRVEVKGEISEDFIIELYPDRGTLEPNSGKPPFEGIWHLNIPAEGEIIYARIKIHRDGKEIIPEEGGTLTILVESIYTEVSEITEEHKGSKLVSVRKISKPEDLEKIISVMPCKVSGTATFGDVQYGIIKVELGDTDSEIALETIKMLRDAVGLKDMDLNANYDEEIEINNEVVTKLRGIRAKFKIKKR